MSSSWNKNKQDVSGVFGSDFQEPGRNIKIVPRPVMLRPYQEIFKNLDHINSNPEDGGEENQCEIFYPASPVLRSSPSDSPSPYDSGLSILGKNPKSVLHPLTITPEQKKSEGSIYLYKKVKRNRLYDQTVNR
jgi:hypothetical protein